MFSSNGVLGWATVAVFVCQACQAATSASYRVSTIPKNLLEYDQSVKQVDLNQDGRFVPIEMGPTGSNQSQCVGCYAPFTVRHFLLEYGDFSQGQPFVYVDQSKYPGTDAFTGYIPDVLGVAGQILNVTFNIDVVKDKRYGSWTNENATSWNGMIGELQRNETDVAAADLTITQTRAKVVHFSQPFFNLGLRILIKKPNKWQDMEELMVVLSPLKPEVWTLTLICFLGVSILLTVIGKFSPWEQLGIEGGLFDITSPGMTFPNSLLFTFGSLLWQGFRGTPRSVSGRTLASFWWIFAMFFLTIYGANLTAFFLTKEPLRQSVPFATFDELSRQTDVKYGYFGNGATSYYFKNSENEVDKRIFQAFSSDPSLGVRSSAEAFERVRSSNGKWAYIAESLLLEHTAAQPPCDTMVVGELRAERAYGFACRKDINICRDLDVAILKMREEGTLANLKWKWFSGPCLSKSQHEAMWNAAPYQDKAQGVISNLIDEKAVSLRRFGAPLILLLIGVFLSFIALGIEIVWVRHYGEPQLIAVEEDKRRIHDAMDMNP